MKPAGRFQLVLITAPDIKTARQIAGAVVKNRLAACANLVPKIESHYWWQGKVECSVEVLILLKTTAAKLARLERLILASHPYDTPEIVAVSLARGTPKYLKWLEATVAPK